MSMRLLKISAVARPEGNGIDLSWSYPDPGPRPPVRVVRRAYRFPADPDDGVLVGTGENVGSAQDRGLRGETVYYYGLFPHTGTPPIYDEDPHNRASATAISPYDFAGQLEAMLPSIYRRYDAERLPAAGTVLAGDEDKGQLRRFLDLPGRELDRLYSLARVLLGATEAERVDGALLPLLAQWIGWRTNHGLPLDKQRNEIRYAPRIYQTIGGLDAVGATVARVTGWAGTTKEYVHNVARTNQPERLNLWSVLRDSAGVLGEPAVASVNFAYDGRPAVVREADGSALVLYHTHRRHGWDVWAKRYTVDGGVDGGWQPSGPVIDRPGIDKHPAAALSGSRLWLFWQSYDPADPPDQRHWRIWFATRTGSIWSDPQVFGDRPTERQMPAAVADGAGGVWLFWRERVGTGWRVRYNRHDGTQWQLADPPTLPLDGTADPRVEDDLHLLFHPGAANQPLWLFWSRQEPGGPPGQTRRTIAYRIKRGLDPAVTDWSPVHTVPKSGAGDYHDRQPFARAASATTIELLWSGTGGGNPTIVRNTLAIGPLTWGSNQTVIDSAYAGRGPAAVDVGGKTLIVYRSNHSLPHDDGALHTLDTRYAGTTTVDTSGTAKLHLRGTFEDFQTYVHDSGAGRVRTNDNRIARDTVGLFLTPDVTDPDQIDAAVARLADTLREFMPVTARAVFIAPPQEEAVHG
jgi:hypothetical protein